MKFIQVHRYLSGRIGIRSCWRNVATLISSPDDFAVSPGFIDTPMASGMGMGLSEEQVEEFKKNVLSMVPLGRMANAVAFLVSDDSSYITGIELFVDGGLAQI